MCPQLLDEYRQITAAYQREGFGIYDDTPDLHRAIALSDAYYGDPSSVLALYYATGKPVMLTNPDVLTNELHLSLAALCVYEDSIWFSSRHVNALFKMDKSDLEAKFIQSFPSEDVYMWDNLGFPYGTCTEINGSIYFSPCVAKEIAAYSLNDNIIDKITFENKFDKAFWGAIAYKDFVFFTPVEYPAIIRLNTVTKEMSCHSDWLEPLRKLKSADKGIYFVGYPLVAEGSIWLVASGVNVVVEINMETCESIVHEVGEKNRRYSGICFDDENYWLLPYPDANTPIVKWNSRTGEIKELVLESRNSHAAIVYRYGYVWVLPYAGSHAYKIDTRSDFVSIAEEFEPETNDSSVLKYDYVQVFGDTIYAYTSQSGKLVQYNAATKERKEGVVRISEETLNNIESLTSKQFSITPDSISSELGCKYYENSTAPLKNFVCHIANEDVSEQEIEVKNRRIKIFEQNNVNADGTSGQAIYNFAKSLTTKGD